MNSVHAAAASLHADTHQPSLGQPDDGPSTGTAAGSQGSGGSAEAASVAGISWNGQAPAAAAAASDNELHEWSAACQASLQRLSPDVYFPGGQSISRTAVRVWEASLKAELVSWSSQHGGAGLQATGHVLAQLKAASDWDSGKTPECRLNHPQDFYTMLSCLDEQNMLPMLTFSFDRRKCEALAGRLPKDSL